MTLPGAPCLYYGDEIGMAGATDPDCRRAFPWDERAWDHELRDLVRALVRERHGDATLRSDHVAIVGAAGGAVAYERRSGDARSIVAVNAGDDPARLDLHLDLPDGIALTSVALPGGFGVVGGGAVVSGGIAAVDLDPRSGAVLRAG
jgi:glycosidase